jgi:biopolymer transport protein ExbB
MDIFYFFQKGGPVMWPLLAASITALTVAVERFIFIVAESFRNHPKTVEQMLVQIKMGKTQEALQTGKKSKDCAARMLVYGLEHDEDLLGNALMHAAGREVHRYERGLMILDTIITLAPLLGLLGTVTGMIHAFGLLGNQELGSPVAITGGIAEALIATGFGLGIAITALLPFNYLNSQLDRVRYRLEEAATRLELLMKNERKYETAALLR